MQNRQESWSSIITWLQRDWNIFKSVMVFAVFYLEHSNRCVYINKAHISYFLAFSLSSAISVSYPNDIFTKSLCLLANVNDC